MINDENDSYEVIDIKKQGKHKDTPVNDSNNVFEMSLYWFNKYFTDRIYPELLKESQENLEDYSSLNKWTKTKHINIGCVTLILFCLALFFPPLIIILPLLYLFQPKDARKTRFARILKYKVFSHFNIKIVSGVDAFLFKVPSRDVIKKIFLLSSSGYSVDDFLLFAYKGLPIKMAEVSIYIEKGRDSIELRHILIGTKINKKFKGETFLYSKDRKIPLLQTFDGQQIFLEDSVFNDNFKTFSTDQIEARYLLTPSFMSRLLKYKLAHKNSLNIVFNNNLSSAANVFLDIDITKDKDFFEINSDPLSAKTYWDILQEIKELLEILDALKLDQDIGM